MELRQALIELNACVIRGKSYDLQLDIRLPALIELNACVIRGKSYDLQLDIRLPLSCGFLRYFDAIG